MKPSSAASGVRNSWLALATKSARICSTRRNSVASCRVKATKRASPSTEEPRHGSGTAVRPARDRSQDTSSAPPVASTRAMASWRSTARRLEASGAARRRCGNSARAGPLAATRRTEIADDQHRFRHGVDQAGDKRRRGVDRFVHAVPFTQQASSSPRLRAVHGFAQGVPAAPAFIGARRARANTKGMT